jgi:deoxycytidylate deaminase
MSEALDQVTQLDQYWLQQALLLTDNSPDPDTRVGAIIAKGRVRIANGWNKLPDGLDHMHSLLHEREKKLKVIVHAERTAVCWSARSGKQSAVGATCYVVATDDTGLTWGGSCWECTKELVQVGVKRIVSPPYKPSSKWYAEVMEARHLLGEPAGIRYVEVSLG